MTHYAADDFEAINAARREQLRAEAARCPSDAGRPVSDCTAARSQPCPAACPRYGLWVHPDVLERGSEA